MIQQDVIPPPYFVQMKNIAPDIFRQRLLIEGFYTIKVDRAGVKSYLLGLADALSLRCYGEPTIYSPAGIGKEENQGFDAFLPLIDSGIAAYIWSCSNFYSVVVYTCKGFNQDTAVDFTRTFFGTTGEVVFEAF